jgi:subtilase family serine protease
MSAAKACLILLAISLCASLPSQGQTSRQPLITGPINNGDSIMLAGSKHQLVQPRFDVGAVEPGLKMTRVILALTPPKEMENQLQTFLNHQQDRTSPDYHHWLTPEQFGEQFGPSPQDIMAVKAWLEQQGLEVTAIAKSGLWMELSGTSAKLERTFQTQMRQYRIAGEMHIANASELSIPAALTPVVRGVVSLHNFFKKPLSGKPIMVHATGNGTYIPDATSTTGVHALAPGDYANIYDINSVYSSGVTGTGVKIGLVARSDVSEQDFANFRILTNLPVNGVTNVLTLPPDPGFDPNSDDSVEATLDAQWSGAVAPGANIRVIVSSSTVTTDGVDLSSAYAVDQNLVDILSVSFGQCEGALGAAENSFFNSLWRQAAAQGISVFVSSGDNGSAGCDDPNLNGAAAGGLAVSGLASTPFNTAVGGTQFSEGPGGSVFWATTNAAGFVSANGYLPEAVWNESCNPNVLGSPCSGKSFSLFAGSGGQSQIYPKPVWQTGFPASPTDTSRDIPDVALSAALHDGYLICFAASCAAGPGFGIIGGTSASSPSFAGIMALIDQTLGGRQGLANYALYRLSKGASASCSSSTRNNPFTPAPAGCIFNDITTGNNAVPGQSGFNATSGFDLATGLGSVNVANLISAWVSLTGAATTTTLSSTLGSTISAIHGTAVPFTVNVTNPNTPAPSGSVALISSSNTAAAVDSVALVASSSTTGTFNGNVSDLPGGTYSLTAHYPGDSVTGPSSSAPITVTITPEASSTSLHAFRVSSANLPGAPSNSFPYGSVIFLQANVTGVSTHGVPTGTVTYSDSSTSPITILSQTSLNVRGESEALIIPALSGPVVLAPGAHVLTTTYSGDPSFTAGTQGSFNLTITKGNPSINVFRAVFVAGAPETLEVFLTPSGSISPTGTIQFFDGGVALGSPVQVTPNTTQFTIPVNFPNEGTHSFTASYSGDATYNAAVSAATSIAVVPPFNMRAAGSQTLSVTVPAGQTAFYNLLIFDQISSGPGSFTGPVTFSCSGAPASSTCSISPASVALSSGISVPFAVTVTTSATASLHPSFPFRGLPVVFAGVLALAFSMKGRRRHIWQVGLVAVLACGISSCGGSGNKTITTPVLPPTQGPTNATIVVTGTSGTHASTINLQLTITH